MQAIKEIRNTNGTKTNKTKAKLKSEKENEMGN